MYFCFRLAQTLCMPVADLIERVTYAELMHWLAYLDEETERAKPPDKRRPRKRSQKELARKIDSFASWANALHSARTKNKGT